ncbi:MAG: NADH-quinone oxidoreductase subunit N [Cytophagales bacterium]|nr:NADH-quinone oxidoreductase subunit N [Cytophagales bacterium]
MMISGLFDINKTAVVYIIKAGLLGAFTANVFDWNLNQSYFNDMILIDNYAVAFIGFAILATLLLFFLSEVFSNGVQHYLTEHYTLIIFSLVGLVCMISYNNLVMLFIGIEILSVSLYILAGSRKKDLNSNEASLKYFLLGSFTTGILLLGITLIYGDTGSFHLRAISNFIAYNPANIPPLASIGVVLLLIALSFKVSIAPFHFWTPDVYEGSPTFITAFMATAVKSVGFAAILKLFGLTFLPLMITQFGSPSVLSVTISILAALTITIGGISAVYQVTIKRLLAYSSVSNAGYLLLAVLVGGSHAPATVLFYAVAYSLASLAIFGVVMAVRGQGDDDRIESLNGLIKTNPFLAIVLGVALSSLAGIPLTAGFFAKFYILYAAAKGVYFWLAMLALANAVVGIYYYYKIVIAAFFKEPVSSAASAETGFVYKLALGLITIFIFVLGIYPTLIYNIF